MTLLEKNGVKTPELGNALMIDVRAESDEAECKKWIFDFQNKNEGPLAFDVETSGLSYFADVRLLQIADRDMAWVFDPEQFPELVALAFGNTQHFTAHNSTFDALHIGRLLYPTDNAKAAKETERIMSLTTDTQVLANLLDPRGRKDGGDHSLKGLTKKFVTPDATDGQELLMDYFKENRWSKAEGWLNADRWHPAYWQYAGRDPLYTRRLHDVLQAKVNDSSVKELQDFDHKVIRVLAGMTSRGFTIDREYGAQLLESLYDDIDRCEKQALIYGVEKIASGAQVSEALMVAGVELTEKTATGKWKMDSDVLESIDHPLAKLVLEGKFARKMSSTWVETILAASVTDGKLHTRFNASGTITDRMTADHGLQTMPAGDAKVRSMFVPSNSEMKIYQLDFANIELRLAGAMSGEPKMVNAFKNGDDLHSMLAEHLFGSDFTEADRKRAKQTHFCWLYGGGSYALSKNCGITNQEAKILLERQKRLYPKLTRWSRSNIERLEYGGAVVETPTGRKIPVNPKQKYKATNYLIQSTAADLFKGALIELSENGFDEYLLAPVHDEVICELPKENAEEIAQEMKAVMGGEFGEVEIVVDGGLCGDSWGAKYA